MSDEEIQDVPAPSAAEEKSSGGGIGGLIPIIAVVILLPVLSFVMTEYVLIPRMKSSFGEALQPHEEKAEHAAGIEAHGDDGHGKKGKDHGDGYGDGHGAGYEFKDIVANLSGSLKSRYIKVSFTVEGHGDDFNYRMEANRARLIDAALSVLTSLSITDLEEPGVKNIVRNDLINQFHTVLQDRIIDGLYFSEFVVQ